jgi:hypothetical protein
MRRRLDLTRTRILAYRRNVQALDERLPAGSDSLRHAAWAGLQDSVPRAALLSIHARVEGTGPSTLEDAPLAQVWGRASVRTGSRHATWRSSRLVGSPVAHEALRPVPWELSYLQPPDVPKARQSARARCAIDSCRGSCGRPQGAHRQSQLLCSGRGTPAQTLPGAVEHWARFVLVIADRDDPVEAIVQGRSSVLLSWPEMSTPSSVMARLASGRTWLASVPAQKASKRSPARWRRKPSGIWLRAELCVHRNSGTRAHWTGSADLARPSRARARQLPELVTEGRF